MKVVIIDYGAGNIKSLQFALQRLGEEAVLSNNPNEIKAASKVIFPGVGEASNSMQKLKEAKLDVIISQLEQPVLGICLGMQLMCTHTEENNTTGLSIFNTKVKRFTNILKVPHIGWNTIKHNENKLFNGIENNVYMYMVHSYYAELCSHTIGKTTYGVEYSAVLQHNNFFGIQSHPEKSSIAGSTLLSNFLKL